MVAVTFAAVAYFAIFPSVLGLAASPMSLSFGAKVMVETFLSLWIMLVFASAALVSELHRLSHVAQLFDRRPVDRNRRHAIVLRASPRCILHSER